MGVSDFEIFMFDAGIVIKILNVLKYIFLFTTLNWNSSDFSILLKRDTNNKFWAFCGIYNEFLHALSTFYCQSHESLLFMSFFNNFLKPEKPRFKHAKEEVCFNMHRVKLWYLLQRLRNHFKDCWKFLQNLVHKKETPKKPKGNG